MANFYVNQNAQPNGDHEVHQDGCYWLSLVVNSLYLGNFWTCWGAVMEAQRMYPRANGCAHCSPTCHIS